MLLRRPPSTGREQRVKFVEQVRFLCEANIPNRSAVENVIAMGRAKGARAPYLHAGAKVNLGLPGAKTHMLGPPTLKQSGGIRKVSARPTHVAPGRLD